jgi:hypothetical protein
MVARLHGGASATGVRFQRVTAAQRTARVPGVVTVITGAALILVSFQFLDWYDVPPRSADTAGNVTFDKLQSSADQLGGAGVASAYFDWLAWVLLILVILAGVAANFPTPMADALRVVGFLLGVIGVAGTYYALAQHFNATGSKHNVFYNSTWGLWLALAGFVAAAAGAALGPRSAQ